MENILFFHGKTTDQQRFTIAGKFIDKGTIIKDKFLEIGAAICNPKDAFVKRVGRHKAVSRLTAKKGHMLIPVSKNIPREGQITTFMSHAAAFQEISSKQFQKQFDLKGVDKKPKE